MLDGLQVYLKAQPVENRLQERVGHFHAVGDCLADGPGLSQELLSFSRFHSLILGPPNIVFHSYFPRLISMANTVDKRASQVMRDESHKTKLSVLLLHVDEWKRRAGSREAVAVAIVECHQRMGLESATGIRFETKGDAFTLAKNAADRIFRWLDDKTKDNNFMPANFEQSILLAMPEDIRLSCVIDMLRPFGLVPRTYMQCYGDDLSPLSRAQAMSKEGGEAISAVIGLAKDSSLAAMENAHRELSESIGEQRAMQAGLEQKIAEARREALG